MFRGRQWPFDEFFRDMDEEFRYMEENMARMLDEARKMSSKKPGEGGPYVYGFSMRVGPDGKPHIEEFGNVPGIEVPTSDSSERREPLTDIIEGNKDITVIAELPGIAREDIKLDVNEESLSIKVDTADRKYYKDLSLPCKVKPDATKARYKNGVLEVKVKRAKEKREKGVSVKVE